MNLAQKLIHEDQLCLPFIFESANAVESAQILPLFSDPPPGEEKIANESEQSVVWSDEGIEDFREAFLWHHLKLLGNGRASAKVKTDVIEWMVSEEEHPFSFVVCCAECGLDPDVLINGVHNIMRHLKG